MNNPYLPRFSLRTLLIACGVCCVLAAAYAYYIAPPREAFEVFEFFQSLPANTTREELRHMMVKKFPPTRASLSFSDGFRRNQRSGKIDHFDSWGLPRKYRAFVFYHLRDDSYYLAWCEVCETDYKVWRRVTFSDPSSPGTVSAPE